MLILTGPMVLSVLVITVAILSVTGLLLICTQGRRERVAYCRELKELLDFQKRLLRVETETQLFYRMVERSLAARLRAPGNPIMTALFDKLDRGTLSTEEALKLHQFVLTHGDELTIEEAIPADLAVKTLTIWSLEVRIYAGSGQVYAPVFR